MPPATYLFICPQCESQDVITNKQFEHMNHVTNCLSCGYSFLTSNERVEDGLMLINQTRYKELKRYVAALEAKTKEHNKWEQTLKHFSKEHKDGL